ncbi:transporter [Sphingomonas bacterium]|uniref:transporter n=1 Tax=Sphingomonas bacterium TaxID=1895847 RepID=UPI0020C61E6B|nr:transporter [Sphingomonas bacterium]
MATAVCLATTAASAAAANDAGQDAPQATGAAPAAAASAPAPICTDRPTKANSACSVPAGDVQIETDVVNWTRLTQSGARTDTILYTNPTFKYGLGTHTDVEVNIAPYATVHTRADGVTTRLGGVGDLYVRLKQRLTSDASKTQVSLIPFVKAPTAKLGIGNKRWEGGIALPANIPVPGGFTLTFGPEIDLLADSDGSGRHANLVSLINISHPVGKKVTVYAEFWNSQNLDPAGTLRQYSADVAVTYLLTNTLQLDVGANFGLNRITPDAQAYVGISTRF